LVLANTCADEEEKEFVKEYIKENDIYIRLGMLFMLIVLVMFCILLSVNNYGAHLSIIHSKCFFWICGRICCLSLLYQSNRSLYM